MYMPRENQGKGQKLALSYIGPYHIQKVQHNTLIVCPVDQPDAEPIHVNMDHVTMSTLQLPDVSCEALEEEAEETQKAQARQWNSQLWTSIQLFTLRTQ